MILTRKQHGGLDKQVRGHTQTHIHVLTEICTYRALMKAESVKDAQRDHIRDC